MPELDDSAKGATIPGMSAKNPGTAFASIVLTLSGVLGGNGALAAQGSHYEPNAFNPPDPPLKSDIVSRSGIPAFSVWMYGADFLPAHWLGLSYQGAVLREPINIVIKDTYSKTPEEAMSLLMASCREAGFPESSGHSTGYHGYISGRFYGQIPVGKRQAFSDGAPEFQNDHGRIFGPYYSMGAYWFVGAFSKENVHPTSKVPHHFVSFNQARDAFASRMEKRAGYEILGYLFLENYSLPGNPNGYSTGDHDGVAIFLNLRDPSQPRKKLDEEPIAPPSSFPAMTPSPTGHR
jgi:hypothetical protein